MQFERDLWRRFGRGGRAGILADGERIELVDAGALSAEVASASLASHQASGRDRSARLVEQAFMLRELARRTGDAAVLSRAAHTTERAIKLAADQKVRIAARLELAAVGVLTADLFGDDQAADAARARIHAIEVEEKLTLDDRILVQGFKARLMARKAMADNDLNAAVEAAGVFDEAVLASDERVRQSGEGRIIAANLRLHRADLLIGFGLQLKENNLLRQAESDLAQLVARLDREKLPITWARTEALRGAALAALGDLDATPDRIAAGAAALTAAVEHLPETHSPLDTARMTHSLALALASLGEACDDDHMFDNAVTAFDTALRLFETAPDLSQRAICAYDRACAVARRAERRGDARALAYAERAFKAELSAVDPSRDPLAWAVIQVALARVYMARVHLTGDDGERSNAILALSEAMEVFTERGLRSLADVALTSLEEMKTQA